ncbi:YkgJ family cysteine cluster protein, partial [Salmonella enterica subsp. enterica]|nr:YkgJ family cysteine cluster protein [Salmonella enterica subsp. enterica]
ARVAHNMLPFVQIETDEADNDDSFEYVS